MGTTSKTKPAGYNPTTHPTSAPSNAPAMKRSAAPSVALGTAPVALFQGYDSFMSAARSTAVTGQQVSAGAVAQTYYQTCTDIESVSTALNISGSMSASFGF